MTDDAGATIIVAAAIGFIMLPSWGYGSSILPLAQILAVFVVDCIPTKRNL